MKYEILTNEQMAAADRATIESGVLGFDLMQNAGKAAAEEIAQRYDKQEVLILCGPGNNGGDGFIIASELKKKNWNVRVAGLIPVAKLKGDALKAAQQWKETVLDFSTLSIKPDDLVIDAVFGTGFTREFEGGVLDVFKTLDGQGNRFIAVDIPSGVNGTTGAVVPYAPKAELTLTFCRKKCGHVLMPGRERCGDVVVCDIGIPDEIVERIACKTLENEPDLWRGSIKPKEMGSNKYDYGHAIIFGGERMTGAACMAAGAALRIGAGICTIIAHPDAADVYRSYQPNIIFEPNAETARFHKHLEDPRRNSVLIGPGAGLDNKPALKKAVLDTCRLKDKFTVLDADALTVFADDPRTLYKALHENCVLTPHGGEFKRLFPELAGDKFERCREVAKITGAVILLKGPDTVIASPDGQVVVNTNAPATLATAGSGDVLAGIILGLGAMGVPPFEAAAAATWIHGEAASIFAHGLIAPDLIDEIPLVLNELY